VRSLLTLLAGLLCLCILPGIEAQDSLKDKSKPTGKTPEQPVVVEPTKDFNYIHLLGVGKLHIRKADKCGVFVKAPAGFPGAPLVQVRGNALVILGGGGVPELPMIPMVPGVKIDLPKIDLGKLPGGGAPVEYHIDVKDLKGILMAGTGKAEVDGLQGKHLSISITGTGSLVASGTLEKLDLSISGTGAFEGKYLETRATLIKHAGLGKALVNAKKELNVSITGTGLVEYIGSPALRKSILGAGRVVQVEE
jgi:hypothetical protein